MAERYSTMRHLVRAMRLANKWTQAQVAELAGVDYKYYQSFEAGRTPSPSLKWVETLADLFGIPTWVLLCDDPDLVIAKTGLSLPTLEPVRKQGRPSKNAL